jgi:hypothetical protein
VERGFPQPPTDRDKPRVQSKDFSSAVVRVIAAAAVALYRTSADSGLSARIALMTLAVLARVQRLSPIIPLPLGGILNVLVQR